MTQTSSFPVIPSERGVFCNRTLNLRSISAVGYDMDYTLIQYNVVEWESLAYAHAKKGLLDQGWPVDSIAFAPELMIQGLIIDKELGNLLKVNRFGYVKSAFHGTRTMDFENQRKRYSRVIVDHREPRYAFLSTLFSLSEACLFAQLVDLWDAHELPMVADYGDLYLRVRHTIDAAHREGFLKAEILADLDRFVELDSQTPETLLDQRDAGKKILLITNSDWPYTRQIMAHAFDRYLPGKMSWRDLFDVVIVSARKPDFFSSRSPLLEVVNDEGLLRPVTGGLCEGTVYFGGNAAAVESYLGLSGDQILFVGDHFFGDVQATKSTMRWRTALVVRELEGDLRAAVAFNDDARALEALMKKKEELELSLSHVRLRLLRARSGRDLDARASSEPLKREAEHLRAGLAQLDERIAPLARHSAQVGNANWGSLMRAGNDKSYLAHLVERHADIYTSRVSNLLFETPFAYFRSARGSLPHDAMVNGHGG